MRRIQDLAAEGMNLEGIRRVMELEIEVQRLRVENDQLRLSAATSHADAQRRPRRYDLVPLRQSVAVFAKRA